MDHAITLKHGNLFVEIVSPDFTTSEEVLMSDGVVHILSPVDQ